MQIRLLVLDIDECAYSSISSRPDKLSQPIIDVALSGNYAGLYGCTHRSVYNLEYCQIEALRIAADHNRIQDFDAIIDNFATYKVLPRFATITGLPLHAISMHDDILYDACGITYETMVKPLEEFSRTVRPGQYYLSREEMIKNWHTKNPQLIQIARHARELYPDDDIVLDYFDDKRSLCEQASLIMQEINWPEGVRLNAHQYDYVCGKITPIKSVSYSQTNGVFFDQSSPRTHSPKPSMNEKSEKIEPAKETLF